MRTLTLILVLALTGCASTLDREATAANLANVEAIVEQNTGFLDGSELPDSAKAAHKLRNDAAVRLAKSMHEDASR